MNDLVKKEDNFSYAIQDMEHTRKVSETLMKTPHYAKMGQDGIYAIVAKAKSLGMDPIEALNGGLYYVQGKVGMSAEAMASRMRAAGHSITKDNSSTATCCVLNGKRGDNGDTWQVSFSIDDAKRAGIYNERGTWGKYPQTMCYNRAISLLYRQLTPDLSKGVGYGNDELKEIVESEPSKIQNLEEIIPTITQEQEFELSDLLANCTDEYIKSLWKTLKNMPSPVNSIDQLPEKLFERIKVAALNNQKVTATKQPEVEEQLNAMGL